MPEETIVPTVDPAGDKGEDAAPKENAEGEPTVDPQNPEAELPTEPGIRKPPSFYFEQRQKARAGADNQKAEETTQDDDEEEEDDVEADIIAKHVQKAVAPLEEQLTAATVKEEVDAFVKDNPTFAKFAETVKTFALHPSRKEVPIQSIFYEVAGPSLMKMGAEAERIAIKKANETAGGGSNGGIGAGTLIGGFDISTPEGLAAAQDAVRRGQKP